MKRLGIILSILLLLFINAYIFYKNNFQNKEVKNQVDKNSILNLDDDIVIEENSFNQNTDIEIQSKDSIVYDTMTIVKNIATPIHQNIDSSQRKEYHSKYFQKLKENNFVEVIENDQVKINLVYASNNNFLNKNVYLDFQNCMMHSICYSKFLKAQNILSAKYPSYKFLIYDAFRPYFIQKKMWDIVRNTSQETYVANPSKGSLHNFGMAIDLTLCERNGKPLDMGTPFDSFSKLSQPRYEIRFLKEGKLTSNQIQNRSILREVMTEAGFKFINNEWWHFEAISKEEAIKEYKVF